MAAKESPTRRGGAESPSAGAGMAHLTIVPTNLESERSRDDRNEANDSR